MAMNNLEGQVDKTLLRLYIIASIMLSHIAIFSLKKVPLSLCWVSLSKSCFRSHSHDVHSHTDYLSGLDLDLYLLIRIMGCRRKKLKHSTRGLPDEAGS